MTHTPGPWEVAELIPDGKVLRKRGTYEIRTPDYDVASDNLFGGPFRKLEDAQLAAAAPDLLAACEEISVSPTKASKIMEDEGFVIDDLSDRWQKLVFTLYSMLVSNAVKAETAIAKAKGETNDW